MVRVKGAVPAQKAVTRHSVAVNSHEIRVATKRASASAASEFVHLH